MSRIGKMPVKIPAGVEVSLKDNVLTVKGPKGTLTEQVKKSVEVDLENGEIVMKALDDTAETNALHGLYRAILHNMVVGVTAGYTKTLIVNGVGWKVAKQGNKLVLNVGFSHPIEFAEVEGVKLECPSVTEITVSGIDKCLVGQVAADIRAIRVPEPYHGYGIRYKDEVIERKEGKTSGKGKK